MSAALRVSANVSRGTKDNTSVVAASGRDFLGDQVVGL